MVREVVSIGSAETVENAVRIMADKGMSSLVVASEGVLQGIITERDVLTRVVAKGLRPAETRVSEVMSKRLITMTPETSLEEANQIMVERRIKKLPVVEPETNRLLGIFSATDFARLQHKLIDAARKRASEVDNDDAEFVAQLIGADEGQHLEFKSSLRYNLVKKCVNPDLELVCIKTICAFMNADGGDLVIGVADDGQAIGLCLDYQTLRTPSKDGFENKLISLFSAKVGDAYLRFMRVSFPAVDGVEVCRVKVYPSTEPVFVKESGLEHFFVRTGNNSRPFSLSDTTKYVMERWR